MGGNLVAVQQNLYAEPRVAAHMTPHSHMALLHMPLTAHHGYSCSGSPRSNRSTIGAIRVRYWRASARCAGWIDACSASWATLCATESMRTTCSVVSWSCL